MKKIDSRQALSILANVGVVFGILLLVYELNQNREMMAAQTRNSVAEMLVNLLTIEVTNSEMAEIRVKRQSGEALTSVESYRNRMLQETYWRFRENVHYQYRNGLYQQDEYLALREVWVRDVDTDEVVRDIYCGRRDQAPTAFTAEIDAAMAKPCD